MKKKISGIITFAVLIVTVSWSYRHKTNEVELSNLALENIEALALPEAANDYCDNFSNRNCISHGVLYNDMYPAN